MGKVIIGIDMSINSTSVCIEQDDEIRFFIYPRTITKAMLCSLESLDVSCNIYKKVKPDNYNIIEVRERFNSKDARFIISKIVDNIKKLTNENDDIKIAIEGIAFMSRGNSIAQFAGYHYILRHELSTITDYDNIYVFQPSSVKKIAGGGKYGKDEMINAFIESTDKNIIKNKFHKYIKAHPAEFKSQTKNTFKKPIDDMADSYWVLKLMKKTKLF